MIPKNIYIGTFLISASTLALEITLSRLLSVITWYHLSFLAISIAMYGLTTGALTVYLKSSWFEKEDLSRIISKVCLIFAFATPVSLLILSVTPLNYSLNIWSFTEWLIAIIASSVPFYLSGIAITLILTKYKFPIGRLYAADLIGASFGSALVLFGLEILDAPSLVILIASIGALASICFIWGDLKSDLSRWSIITFVIITVGAFLNASTSNGIQIKYVKGRYDDPKNHLIEKWNSFSRVVVYDKFYGRPQYWGASQIAPEDEKVYQYPMQIDGDAGTVLRRFTSPDDISHLRYDVTNIAYYLRPEGGAFIIGVGGGRDIQSAVLFGHEKITGVDVNPIFIDLLENNFKDFAGIANREGINLYADEARSYLSKDKENYAIIQMALVDTWAATGAGAFTLSENVLYTVEAWKVFIDRLSDTGIFTVSRWYNPYDLDESGRIVSLAVASLLSRGVSDPSKHISMVTSGRISSLILSKNELKKEDIDKLSEVCSELKFDLAIVPGLAPSNKLLKDIVSSKSLEELNEVVDNEKLNLKPPTDENPYFFNMLRLGSLNPFSQTESGIVKGNLIATITLINLIFILFILTVVTMLVPLFIKLKKRNKKWGITIINRSAAIYFSLIGIGFMLIEVALIQRLSVFLSHPVYAFGIVLSTIIISSGIGSYISEYLPLTRKPWILIIPGIAVFSIIATKILLSLLLANMITSTLAVKVGAVILVIFPLGMILGIFFPTGVKIMYFKRADEVPWYWALNGIFGVLSSAVAVFISIYISISTNFIIAAGCYFLLVFSLNNMYKMNLDHKDFSS